MADTTAPKPESPAASPEPAAAATEAKADGGVKDGAKGEATPGGHHGAADGAKAKAVQAAKEKIKALKNFGPALKLKLKEAVLGLLSLPKLLITGSLGTRLLILGFVASCALLFMTGRHLYQHYHAQYLAEREKVLALEKATAEAKFKQEHALELESANLVFLEQFTAAIRSQAGDTRALDVELYVETDEPEVAQVLKAHRTAARDLLNSVLSAQKSDGLTSDEGKEELKKTIAQALSKALKKWAAPEKLEGGVHRVFFTKFVLN